MTLRDKLAALTAPCREADAEIAVMLQVLPANLQHIDDGLTVHPDTACPHLIEIQTAEGGYVGGFGDVAPGEGWGKGHDKVVTMSFYVFWLCVLLVF